MKTGLKLVQTVGIAAVMAIAVVGCATGGGGDANPLVGKWNFTVESQLGTMEQVITVNDDMTGMVNTVEPASEVAVNNFMLDGDAVTFDIVFDIEGTELAAKFEGTMDGDSITGESVTELGNGTVTAMRAE